MVTVHRNRLLHRLSISYLLIQYHPSRNSKSQRFRGATKIFQGEKGDLKVLKKWNYRLNKILLYYKDDPLLRDDPYLVVLLPRDCVSSLIYVTASKWSLPWKQNTAAGYQTYLFYHVTLLYYCNYLVPVDDKI